MTAAAMAALTLAAGVVFGEAALVALITGIFTVVNTLLLTRTRRETRELRELVQTPRRVTQAPNGDLVSHLQRREDDPPTHHTRRSTDP